MKQPNKRSLKYVYVHDFHHLSPMGSHLQWGQAVRVANVQHAVEIIEGARTRSDLNILNMPTCLLWMASALGQPWASCLMFLDGLTLAKRSDSGTSSISTRSFQKGLHTRSVNRINRFWIFECVFCFAVSFLFGDPGRTGEVPLGLARMVTMARMERTARMARTGRRRRSRGPDVSAVFSLTWTEGIGPFGSVWGQFRALYRTFCRHCKILVACWVQIWFTSLRAPQLADATLDHLGELMRAQHFTSIARRRGGADRGQGNGGVRPRRGRDAGMCRPMKYRKEPLNQPMGGTPTSSNILDHWIILALGFP